ncbi:NAD-dependent epimerase/dehydratase family protein [Oceanobacillus sp. FSL K6-0127]|uniref:NAD-dependent epimerase/dehydratase family protein n=1 Tax=Oceanobacillus sp. FSL K6-0127 TaxID=2921420 RepID=UPI0030EBC7FF
MKRILITGTNSYVGNSFEKWLKNYPGEYSIDKVSLRNRSWKKKNFSNYDVVLHVAGIAHRKETKQNADLYYRVNRDLALEVAEISKHAGVKHFIFLSSMSVYGTENAVIDKSTPLTPKSNYGKSKLQAEELIGALNEEKYKVAILRPPMIYGANCKGNYTKLAGIAKKSPIFPDIKNKRSMIYVDNLSEFIRLLIDNYNSGLFFPQNSEYVETKEMVSLIAKTHGKNIKLIKLFNPIISMLKISTVNKAFGNLIYEKNMSEYKSNYNIASFNKSIKLTENVESK